MYSCCIDCGQSFEITSFEADLAIQAKTEPRMKCFDCQVKHHLAFWIFGKFRKSTSALSGESLVTVIPEHVRFPIYTRKEWISDAWDALLYGVDYDPTVSFFTQLKSLQDSVPRPHQMGSNNTNCDYCDDAWNSKDCYLTRSVEKCEELSYGYRCLNVKNSFDATFCFDSDQIVGCMYCMNSYNLAFSENCKNCVDSYFLFDCRNCTHCFMSTNLRNKTYCINNIQYSKEDYFEKLKTFKLDSHTEMETLRTQFKEMVKNISVHRADFNIQAHNATGDYLTNVKNCENSFFLQNAENVSNFFRGFDAKNSVNTTGCWHTEQVGNISCCVDVYDVRYSIWSSARYSEYCDLCEECEYCFGCVGLRKKKYCILNTQYTPEEYKVLKEKIISDMKSRGEYGHFPPYNTTPCGFNDTTAYLYFGDTEKEKVLQLGGYWDELDTSQIDGISPRELPDSIFDTENNITKQALICDTTKYRFNISQAEFDFYIRKGIALPREHFDLRTRNRMKSHTVFHTQKYNCTFCRQEIDAYYDDGQGYTRIACVPCYQKEIA